MNWPFVAGLGVGLVVGFLCNVVILFKTLNNIIELQEQNKSLEKDLRKLLRALNNKSNDE